MIPETARATLEAFNVSRESLGRLEIYVETLQNWQRRINLVGKSTTEDIWERHVIDGAQLLRYMPPQPRHLADLGSGAGIPGLILSLAAGHRADLYESNGKKAAFLSDVIRRTGTPARVMAVRIETLANAGPEQLAVDYVVSRALAPLADLLDYAQPFLVTGAKALFHKGQDIDVELTEATKYWKINYQKHPSLTDSKAVILEIEEAVRVGVRKR